MRFPTNTDILGIFLSDLPNSLIILSHVLIFYFALFLSKKRNPTDSFGDENDEPSLGKHHSMCTCKLKVNCN